MQPEPAKTVEPEKVTELIKKEKVTLFIKSLHKEVTEENL